MVLQTNVTPVYRFFNGRSQFYQFGTPAVPAANGRVLMAGPLGSVTEAGSKITAMKRHEGRQPIDPVDRMAAPAEDRDLLPERTTSPPPSPRAWRRSAGRANGYAFAETERFMGLYHEVAPKEQALRLLELPRRHAHGLRGARLHAARPPATASRSARRATRRRRRVVQHDPREARAPTRATTAAPATRSRRRCSERDGGVRLRSAVNHGRPGGW